MTYRVYLLYPRGELSDQAFFTNRKKAEPAFAALVMRKDLDGLPISAVLGFKGNILAVHRFDASHASHDHWRNRLDQIQWPNTSTTHTGSQVSPQRTVVSLDAGTVELAKLVGRGNVLAGIRIALRSFPIVTGSPSSANETPHYTSPRAELEKAKKYIDELEAMLAKENPSAFLIDPGDGGELMLITPACEKLRGHAFRAAGWTVEPLFDRRTQRASAKRS